MPGKVGPLHQNRNWAAVFWEGPSGGGGQLDVHELMFDLEEQVSNSSQGVLRIALPSKEAELGQPGEGMALGA